MAPETTKFEDGAVYMPPGAPAVTTREGLVEVAAAGFGPWAAEQIAIYHRQPDDTWKIARLITNSNS